MANVSFLRGTQSKLDTLLAAGSGYTEGAFYLTTDSDRLYFAQSATELVHLNHNVIHVANVAALPAVATATEGDFYYAKEENVLCTKVNGAWKQINKDTNTNNDTSVRGIDDVSVTSNANGITVSFDIKQTSKNLITNAETEIADIPVSFTINRADIATANNIDVGVATSAVPNGVKIATSGDGSSGEGFNLTATGNATVTRDTNGNVNITAKDTTYDLGAANGKIVLKNNLTNVEDTISVSSGNDSISISAAADQVIINHKDYVLADSDKTTSTAKPAHGGTFTVIDSIETERGHVTGFNTKTVTLPADKDTTSSLNVAANTVTLNESDGKSYSVTFDNGADIEVATNKTTIEISHSAYDVPDVTLVDGEAPGHGGKFTVVDSIVTNNGHITEYKTKEITLPTDNNTTNASATVSADNAGKLSVSVTDSAGKTVNAASGAVLYYEVNGQKVYNQGKIDFYTKDEIDTKIEAVNAMVYRGTVGTNGTVTALPSSNVQIGDTYKVSSAGTYGGHSCDVGDLLIATGTEKDGVIDGTITWTYVPSGDDTDSQYQLNVANNTATLKNTTSNKDVGSLTIAAGAGNDTIDVSTAGSTITVAHKTFGNPTKGTDTTAKPSHGGTFTVLDSITTENGHVTGYVNKVVTLPTDKDTTSVLSVAEGNKIHLAESDGKAYDVTLNGDNTYINVESNVANKTITAKHAAYKALAATPGTNETLDHGDSFTIVESVERDGGGHLSKFVTRTLTLPSDKDTTSTLSVVESGNTIRLSESDGKNHDVKIVAGDEIAISASAANKTITVNHGTIETTNGTADAVSPGHGGNFTVLDSVTVVNGHVTDWKTKTVNLPTDNNTTYNYAGAVSAANNVATYTTTLTGSDGKKPTATMKITSDNLTVSASSNTVTMNLEWGKF